MLAVVRVVPVRMIKASPYGKTRALSRRKRPGVYAAKSGEAFATRSVPHAKDKMIPAIIEEARSFGNGILALFTAARDSDSSASAGVRCCSMMMAAVLLSNDPT